MIFETIFLSLISRGGGGNNGGNTPPPISEEERQKLYKEIETKFQESEITKEGLHEFIDSIVDNGFHISGYPGGYRVLIESNDTANNDRIYVDRRFLAELEQSKDNGYTMSSIIDEYVKIPDALKNGTHTPRGPLDGIYFTAQGSSSGTYDQRDNEVRIPTSWLEHKVDDANGLGTTLIHELTHRADYEQSTRTDDFSLIGFNQQPGGKSKKLSSGLFHDIGLKEQASAYSRSYKYTESGRKTTSDKKIIKYDSENLSETMSVMHMKHNYGGNALVEDPRGTNRDNRITVDRWVELNPGLNEIGEKLYNAKNYNEFKAVLIWGDSHGY